MHDIHDDSLDHFDVVFRRRHGQIKPINPQRAVVEYTSRRNYTKTLCLGLSNLSQPPDGRSDGSGRWGSESVSSTGVDLLAGLAVPDSDVGTLDGVLYVS